MVDYPKSKEWEFRKEVDQLQREMNQLTRRAFRPGARRGVRVFPSIIISTTEESLVVRAEVPGMKLDDLEVSVSGDVLTVRGTRLTGAELEGGWYHRRERESGGFSRAIRLPAEVDGDRAEAGYTAGVLTVTLPLKRPARPKEIHIGVAEG